MPAVNGTEIIDLTTPSSPPGVFTVNSEDNAVVSTNVSSHSTTPTPDAHPKRKSRKRRKTQDLEEGEIEDFKEKTDPMQRTLEDKKKNGIQAKKSLAADIGSMKEEQEPVRQSPNTHDQVLYDGSGLFFIDVKPTLIPNSTRPTLPAQTPDQIIAALLLPSHVSISFPENEAIPIEIITSSQHVDFDDEDYIEYLDTEDRKAPGLVRYFEEEEQEQSSKPSKFLCKNCGEEGSHRTYECTVQICLTCGARNEHSTRSCPISKTCYTCGMRGHVTRTCPNGYSRMGSKMEYDGCDRCGSTVHKTNECPTLWRIYDYHADEGRDRVLRRREGKRDLGIGKGGEGYIAGDEWCYNCGACGHWGDNCNEVSHPTDFPAEHSAFSAYNIMSGPFFDPTAEILPSTSRYVSWEQENDLPDGWGKDAPTNVGKRGRKKEKDRLVKRVEQQEEDLDDWFGNAKNRKNHNNLSNGRNQGAATEPKKMSIGFSKEGRRFQPSQSQEQPRRPSLLERLSDGRDAFDDQGSRSQNAPSPKNKRHRRGSRESRDVGPRYKGGYSR